ncbi:nardilysin-like [Papaver somniferum]|nr:nardilysin-like [Papaver somniferum]
MMMMMMIIIIIMLVTVVLVEEDDGNGGGSGDKDDDDDDGNDVGDKEDEEDNSTILKLVRERMNLFANALCCSADKGEVFDPDKQRRYADYCRHVENPNAKKMFAELAKEGKRTKKTRSQLGEERVEQGQGSHHPLDEQGSREDGGSPGGCATQGPNRRWEVSRSGRY